MRVEARLALTRHTNHHNTPHHRVNDDDDDDDSDDGSSAGRFAASGAEGRTDRNFAKDVLG
jgi:hypothetical protein